jgi:hypothetical protein
VECCRHAYADDSEEKVLDQLPHSLRREVLKNIYLRSMRRVPILFVRSQEPASNA